MDYQDVTTLDRISVNNVKFINFVWSIVTQMQIDYHKLVFGKGSTRL